MAVGWDAICRCLVEILTDIYVRNSLDDASDKRLWAIMSDFFCSKQLAQGIERIEGLWYRFVRVRREVLYNQVSHFK